jgi:hypothetical protein
LKIIFFRSKFDKNSRGRKKNVTAWMNDRGSGILFFPVFSCCSKIGDQPQEGLAKLGYKTKNREIERKSKNFITC